MNTVQAEYTYDWNEFRQVFKLVYYTRVRKIFYCFCIFSILFLVVLGIIHIVYYDDKVGAVIILLFALGISFPIGFPIFRVRKNFKKSSFKEERIVWNINEEQIVITSSKTESKFVWSLIIEAMQCKEGYFLISEGGLVRWLPQKAFASQEDFETFEKLVKEKVSVIKKV